MANKRLSGATSTSEAATEEGRGDESTSKRSAPIIMNAECIDETCNVELRGLLKPSRTHERKVLKKSLLHNKSQSGQGRKD